MDVVGLVVLAPLVTFLVLLIAHVVVGSKLARLRRRILAHVREHDPERSSPNLKELLKAPSGSFADPETEHLLRRYRLLRLYHRIMLVVEILLVAGIAAMFWAIVWLASQID